jgi:uncharacterized protein YndB with AHSA1/START domain
VWPMANIEIEREVVIDAPLDVVWRTVTEPDQISQWFADRVELVLEPGGDGAMYFGEGDDGEGGPLVVEVVEPPTRFSFRWNHPAGERPVAGNSVLVEFTLVAEGGEQTRLRVVESGLDLLAWPEEEKEHYAGEHNGGWATFLGRLQTLLAGRPRE